MARAASFAFALTLSAQFISSITLNTEHYTDDDDEENEEKIDLVLAEKREKQCHEISNNI